MNILIYSDQSPIRGGIEVFIERRAEALRKKGHTVSIAGTVPGDFSPFDTVEVNKCAAVADLEKFPPEKTHLFVHDHDSICPRSYAYTPFHRNCTLPSGLFPCIFCAPVCKKPLPALKRVLEENRRKAAMRKMREIIVISHFMKNRLVANGIAETRITVEKPPLPDFSKVSGDVPDIDMLFAGQLIRGKGLQLLLRAMAKMKKKRTLDVIGTGNMEKRLKKLSLSLGLGSRVRWHGFCRDAARYMRGARCIVVPSVWQEPYGLVAAEAAALGKYVVAFNIGGIAEACSGGSATLLPPGDIDAMALALDEESQN